MINPALGIVLAPDAAREHTPREGELLEAGPYFRCSCGVVGYAATYELVADLWRKHLAHTFGIPTEGGAL